MSEYAPLITVGAVTVVSSVVGINIDAYLFAIHLLGEKIDNGFSPYQALKLVKRAHKDVSNNVLFYLCTPGRELAYSRFRKVYNLINI